MKTLGSYMKRTGLASAHFVTLSAVVWLIPSTMTNVVLCGVAAQSAPTISNGNDLVCGPRCVQHIMETYGIYENEGVDIIELIKRIQMPDLESGARLDRISAFLMASGVHTAAVEVKKGLQIDWPYPVLLHLHPQDSKDEVGHYVVWHRRLASGGNRLWCGLHGYEKVSDRRLWSRASGVALITSPVPIDQPSDAFRSDVVRVSVRCVLAMAVVVVCLLVGPKCISWASCYLTLMLRRRK